VFFDRPRVKERLHDLLMEACEIIAFKSISGVSFLTKVFGLDMMFSPADQRSSGDRIRRSVGISHCS